MGCMVGIFTYIYHKSQPNLGKNTIYGWHWSMILWLKNVGKYIYRPSHGCRASSSGFKSDRLKVNEGEVRSFPVKRIVSSIEYEKIQ